MFEPSPNGAAIERNHSREDHHRLIHRINDGARDALVAPHLSLLAKCLGILAGAPPSAWPAWLLIALMIAVILLQLLTQYRLKFLES